MTDLRLPTLSPWLVDSPEATPRFEGEREVDAAVIGGGLTGLSSALALRREGLTVAVLEADVAGCGASGRNAGHLTPSIGKDLPTLTALHRRQRVSDSLQLAQEAISHVESLIHKYELDCSYEPVGNVVAAVDPRQHRAIDRAAAAAEEHGLPGQLLDAVGMERRGLPRAFTRGYFEPQGGILDPGRLVHGLRRAAVAAGAELYENSLVTGLRDESPAVVETPGGRIRCHHVIVATNAYTPSQAFARHLRRAAIRIQVQLFRTAPLTDLQMARVGWLGREGILTAHEILENFRLTPDNRILGGSKTIRAGFGRRALPDTEPHVCAALEAMFRQRFPELSDVPIEQHWGGPIFTSLNFLPAVGRGGRHGNILHSVGYAGHGVAQASYAGEMMADLLLDREGPGRVLWSHRGLRMPPEPLRWLGFKTLVGYFEAVDRRSDRAAARRELD